MRSYVALVQEHHGELVVTFPDLPGCRSTHVATIEEATVNASLDLAVHLQALIENGQAVPKPSSIHEVVNSPEFKPDAVAILLTVHPILKKTE